jgi:ketosteroid isomerase-like protein
MSNDNLAIARGYLAALEAFDMAAARDLFDPAIEQIEYPNLLKPKGDRRTAAALAADGEKGRRILSAQTFEVRNALAEDDRVALEVLWTGVLAVPLGPLAAGAEMTCHSAIFLDFRDGKIVGQRNFDCFPPLA